MFFKNKPCRCIIKSQALLRSAGDGACVGWGSGRGGLGGSRSSLILCGHCWGPGSALHGLLQAASQACTKAASSRSSAAPSPPVHSHFSAQPAPLPAGLPFSLCCSPFILPSKPSSGASPCGALLLLQPRGTLAS